MQRIPPTDRQRRSYAAAAAYLSTRTAANAHRLLLERVRPGMSVLDVGCANGSITRSIAELTEPGGYAVGLDSNVTLILEAVDRYAEVANLSFRPGCAYTLPYESHFDLVTCARTLQWCADPAQALGQCVQAARPGGMVILHDYNHEKVCWEPAAPRAFAAFYTAYLSWRRQVGFNPAMADALAAMARQAGLENIRVSPQHERYVRGEPGFEENLLLWRTVLDKSGDHLVQAGFMRASAFREASDQYDRWAAGFAQVITMYALAVEGMRPAV